MKKQQKTEAEVDYDELRKRYEEQNGIGPNIERAAKRVLNTIGGYRVDAVLGKLFTKTKIPAYYIEQTIERFWANYIRETGLPMLERIHAELVKRKITNDDRFDFNDLDDKVWYIPGSEQRMMVHRSQNFNLLFQWDKVNFDDSNDRHGKLHIRRYWDILPSDSKFDKQDEKTFLDGVKKHGRSWALAKLGFQFDTYSDDILDNPYPRRPSFETFRKAGFKFRYEDGRDIGYVLTYTRYDNKVDWAYLNHHLINTIFECYVPSIESALTEES